MQQALEFSPVLSRRVYLCGLTPEISRPAAAEHTYRAATTRVRLH